MKRDKSITNKNIFVTSERKHRARVHVYIRLGFEKLGEYARYEATV